MTADPTNPAPPVEELRDRPDFSRITLRGNIERALRDNRDVHPSTMLDRLMSVIPVSVHPDQALLDHLSSLTVENERLREALRAIERWDMPATGEFWQNADGSLSDRPMSYGACYGSLGEQQYVRACARAALSSLPAMKGEG